MIFISVLSGCQICDSFLVIAVICTEMKADGVYLVDDWDEVGDDEPLSTFSYEDDIPADDVLLAIFLSNLVAPDLLVSCDCLPCTNWLKLL